MRRFTAVLVAGVALVLTACTSSETSTVPVVPSEQPAANSEGCRSGWVIRTGANGEPVDSTCADDQQ